MKNGGERLPYPGLRSFTREETDLFFGREGCVDDMVDRLAATRFLAVLGPSGSGKSSLVKTGLLDALELGLLHQAGSRWHIADFRPGDRPLLNLAESMLRAGAADPNAPVDEEEVRLLRAFLGRGPRSVVEWCEAVNLPDGTNLLLLVDQFEELFRYSAYSEREEAEAFVATLLESAAAPIDEARIYVAITMRSEYLGAAALISGLAEAINKGLYLTPRLSRDQVREAIVGPAAVCGFEIEPALVNRLINDLSSFAPWEDADTGHQLERLVRRADQLPLMQHVLNRLWSIASERSAGRRTLLTLKDYEGLGGLRGALAAHGREILDELLPEHRAAAPAVFRALTAGSSLAEAVRRPTEFGELVEIARGEEIAVREIVEAFRAPGRNFLLPPRPTALRPETVIDISHESLIRQWEEFAAWLQQEIASAATWRRLVDQAERHQRGEADLLSGVALGTLANWWDTERPTAAWAKRYGGDFELVKTLLEESRRAEEAVKQAETADQRRKGRNRLLTFAVVVILCIVTPLTIFAGYSALRANEEAARALAAANLAETARLRAEEQRQVAEAAERQAAVSAAVAQAEKQRADQERERAVASQQVAEGAARQAERERERANQERQRADEERQRALAAEQEALRLASRANDERERALAALEEAEQARVDVFKANLELPAQRIGLLQHEGAWDAAADLLSTLWMELLSTGEGRPLYDLFIEPITRAYERQSLAEYPVVPNFLDYSALDGWSGRRGRFRVYALDRRSEDESLASGNKTITVFDVMTGSVTGSFELPPGTDLGSELDQVTPDGNRVAIVTDNGQIALWASGQARPTLIPVPPADGGEVDLDQIAPVNSDDRFALHLMRDYSPSEIQVADPAEQAVTFNIMIADLASAGGLGDIYSVGLLGLVDGQLYVLVNEPDGRVVQVDVATNEQRGLDTGAGVTGAAITPDGHVLLALTCPNFCEEQKLTAYDLRQGNTALWVQRVPSGLKLSREAIHEVMVDGVPTYSALIENEGIGIVFRFPKGQPDRDQVVRLDGQSTSRIGALAFDGDGGFKVVEDAAEGGTTADVVPAGRVANFQVPVAREKLRLYVAPNSVAIHQGDDALFIAGVTYDGDLLVYRMEESGAILEDDRFRQIGIAESNCIAAIAFGGDGQSLLMRHIDGSLHYVAAVGTGASVGWHAPSAPSPDGSREELTQSSPETDCDAPEAVPGAVTEKIVAVDETGRDFALLDSAGVVWQVSVVDGREAAEDGAGAEAEGSSPSPAFAPPVRIASNVTWIAGDPSRGRIALARRAGATDDVTSTGADTSKKGRGDLGSLIETSLQENTVSVRTLGSGARGNGAASKAEQPTQLPGRGEPSVVTFSPGGDVVVVYAGGRFARFQKTEADGGPEKWVVGLEVETLKSAAAAVFASNDEIAIINDRDVMVAYDAQTGARVGHARIPANPSMLALLENGNVLSLEWDTDSAATVTLRELLAQEDVADVARLMAMRSQLDPLGQEDKDRIVLLTRVETMLPPSARGDAEDGPPPEQHAAEADEATSQACAIEAMRHFSQLESRLLGDAGIDDALALAPECAAGSGLLAAAERLARRIPAGGVRHIFDDEAFSQLLQAAAAGDADATRLVGAVLAHIADMRDAGDVTAIAADAARFGTSLPTALLKEVAAGAPIAPSLLEFAEHHGGFDPAAHQFVAHSFERRINDIEALTEALFEFSLAERLYRDTGRAVGARFTAHRRAQLARLLPDERVLDVYRRREAWAPETENIGAGVTLDDLSEDVGARRALDIENAGRLAERLPDSLLLAGLHSELERARIHDLAGSDPRQAARLLLDLGRRASGERGWSPDMVRDYLALAREVDSDGESAFKLAIEALKAVAAAFPNPIHGNGEAVDIFTDAASVAAATASRAPKEIVLTAAAELDLPLIDYQYGTLPGTGEENKPLVAAAARVLEAAAQLAEAIADRVEGAKWRTLRGETLFWLGILVNDRDQAQAAETFWKSADAFAPLVEDSPDDVELSFRYAEALRWIGLTEPSSKAVAAIEEEAIRLYVALWGERATLATDFVASVGAGYGFGLANMGKTLRETSLADLTDGRAAEEHVGWVLEVLALAAEMDAINAAMIDMGAVDGDSRFVAGWYRMSSYGFAIGFLSGLVNVESGQEPVSDCDVRAADPFDPRRRAHGNYVDHIQAADAEASCSEEVQRSPDDPRATFQLARAISAQSDRGSEAERLAREAAEQGVAPAYSLVATIIDATDTTRGEQAHFAASQRTVIESFPILYPYLAERVSSEREGMGLAWYAEKAAMLGVPEAHLVLATSADGDAGKLLHAKLAARLWDEAGNRLAADAARRTAEAIVVSEAEAAAADAEVAAWTAEALVALPEEATATQ